MKFLSTAFLLTAPLVWGAPQTTVRFQPGAADVGPFPTNFLTKTDQQQKTGLHVSLTGAPGCTGSAGVSCADVTGLLNQLDGFSVNPQIRLCFSGPIDLTTVRAGVRLVPVGRSSAGVGINQLFYDETTSCLLAKPDQVLDQGTQYVLLVSTAVHDRAGKSLTADEKFTSCVNQSADDYCVALRQALNNQNDSEDNQGNSGNKGKGGKKDQADDNSDSQVVAASLFTTMSATDWLEKARQFLYTSPVPPVSLPAGQTSVFALSNLKSFQWLPQTNVSQPPSAPQDIPLSALSGVKQVAFGLYLSPNFLQVSGPQAGSIPVTPTAMPIAGPVPPGVTSPDPSLAAAFAAGYVPISYHVFLPAASTGQKTPVVLYGHGFSDSQFGAPTAIASTLAQAGFATLAFEVVGHGFGANSAAVLVDKAGTTHPVAAPGRTIYLGSALRPDGSLQPADGCVLGGPVATRDCARQTAVDVMALVRAIKASNGSLGLGLNLDPDRIYYIGQSLGAIIGTLAHAVEPGLQAAVLNAGGDSVVDIARLSLGHQLADVYLSMYNPALFGQFSAIANPAQKLAFDYFFPYRDQVVDTAIPGAGTLQTAFEVADWINIPGAPLAFAPHLQQAPLPGVPAKPTLFQFGYGDLEVANPTTSALIRDTVGPVTNNAPLPATYFRYDTALTYDLPTHDPHLAHIFMPGFPFSILPHRILANPTLYDPANADERFYSLALQTEAALFFRSGGNSAMTTHMLGWPFFDIPRLSTLPNTRNFTWPIQVAPTPQP